MIVYRDMGKGQIHPIGECDPVNPGELIRGTFHHKDRGIENILVVLDGVPLPPGFVPFPKGARGPYEPRGSLTRGLWREPLPRGYEGRR